MASPPVTLGPFELLAPHARGGMAEVWRAVHPASGAAVAVKVLAGDASARPVLVRALATEVRAAAALRHPNVVRVLDAGQVDADAAAATCGRLHAGAPWLAMRWAPETAETSPPAAWAGVRRILLATLAALAHAHAHGVVHRDVKPANVLLGARGTPRLADFGLALSLDDPEVGRLRGGTPGYAAPEQLAGPTWETGPWTDLYATGALAWALVCGRAPSEQVASPRMRVPREFLAWVERMTAANWRARYASAADARRALARLGPPDVPTTARLRPIAAASTATVLFDEPEPTAPGAPLTEGWLHLPTRMGRRPPADPPAGPGPRDIGLGLLGLAEPPMVGRSVERAALWSRLARVRRGRRPEAVVLVGPAGAGTTRLARWLVRAADELGLGLPLVSEGDPEPEGRARELAAMALGSLDPVACARARLPEALADGVAELLGQTPVQQHRSPRERRRLVRAVTGALAGPRVVVLALDAATDPEAAAIASEWLDAPDAPPALILLTTSQVTPALDGLLARRATTRLDVPHLGHDHAEALVRALLPLASAPATVVAGQAQGSPGRIVEALRHWALLGQLAPSEEGFVPTGPLPDTDEAFARARVDAVLAGLPATDRRALEVAAAVGPAVDDGEWREVCGYLAAPPSAALLPGVLRAGVGRPEPARGPGRWRLARGVSEVLLSSGGDAALHEACARMLSTRGPAGFVRRARHLERAGSAEALGAWITAMNHLYDYASEEAAAIADHAATLFGPDTPLERRMIVVRFQCQLAHLLGHQEVIELRAREAVSLAQQLGPLAQAQALFLLALACETCGNPVEAQQRHLEAADLLEGSGALRSAAVALGNAAIVTGASATHAMARLERALRLAPQADDSERAVRTWLSLNRCVVWVHLGEVRRADEALAALEAEALASSPLNVAYWHLARAIASAGLGQPAAALTHARESIELRARMGLPAVHAQRIAAGALLELDRPEEALAVLSIACTDGDDVVTVGCVRVQALARLGRVRQLRLEVATVEAGERGARQRSVDSLTAAARTLRETGHPRLARRLERAVVAPEAAS